MLNVKNPLGIAAGLIFSVSSLQATVFTFGSANDGLGGFTQSAADGTTVTWTTTSNSVQYRSESTGTVNSSFLGEVVLDRSNGNAYRLEGVVTLTSGYADDNNRVGFYLFGDAPVVPNEDELGAIGMVFNMDDGVTSGSPGTNADDNIALRIGIDSPALSPNVSRNEANTAFAQDLFGTTISMATDIYFFNDGSNDVIQIDATLTDAGGAETTVSTNVQASGYTGDYFGFVTRARVRNFGSAGDPRSDPWVMDYESFSVTPIPEPAACSLFAIMGGGLVFLRRRTKP